MRPATWLDVELVAACDIIEDNVQAFAEQFGIPDTFADYHEMLAEVEPEAVSICTWPHLHEQMVIDCAQAGVKLIYCEKPMADTIGGARRMMEVCDRTGTALNFNHQRRYGKPFSMAKQMLDDGAIGDLVRIEWGGANIYDYGSHNFDMAQYFNDETPPSWVMAQIDYHTESFWFGAHNENEALALIGYEGAGALRYRTFGGGDWQQVDTEGEGLHAQVFIERAIADAVNSYRNGTRSMMDAHNAIHGTEAIFACWESSRLRARVETPIEAEGNPLQEMVEAGDLSPQPAEE